MKKTLFTILALSTQLCMQAQNMKALQISTTENDIWHVYPSTVTEGDDNPMRVKFKSEDVNSTFRSFGTCFNELDWYALQLLPEAEQEKFFYNLFNPKGDLRFTLGRIPMGASDYAAQPNFYTELYHERNEGIGIWDAWYSPDEMPKGQQDLTMEHFTLERDRKAVIPFIKRAMKENQDMSFWCSPWSPPQWMKKSEHYSNRAGYGNGLDVTYPRYTTQFKMEDPILKAHAMYFSKFITEYGKEGIPITGCCYQNEAYTVNYYPNTSWSAEDAGRFNADYLIPYLNEHNPGVKVWLGTLNTADINNIETILNTVSTAEGYKGKRLSEMVAGAGFQWEGRDAIATIRKDYPNLEMIQTESECGGGTFDWGAGVHTFELIHHYLKNGCVDYTNWNSILGGNGRGPFMNWWQNALVHINERLPRANVTCTATYTPEYYAYKHYSHFICQGTKILKKPIDKDLLTVAQRPDGVYIAIVGNEASNERSLKLDIDGHCIDINVPARSMNTFLIGTDEQINTLATEEGLKEGEEQYPASTHSVYIDPTQKYFLYNVKEGKYLDAGGRFGTRPVLDEIGCEYTLEYSDAGDDYYLATPYGNGTHLGWLNVSGIDVEQNYYMDSGSSKERLTFYPTNEENVYAIGINGYYLTYKTSLSIGDLNEGELGWGQQIKTGDNVNEIDGCQWRLVTAEERWAQARKATAENPADVTFACIKNPSFNRLHNGNDTWSFAPGNPGTETDPYREYIGEFYNKESLDASLDLTHLPAGVYEFSVAGFYRGTGSANAADENTSVYVYATGDNGEPVTAYLPTCASGSHEGKLNKGGSEVEVADASGFYVPNDGTSAVFYLGLGQYSRTAVSTTVKDGKMKVGFGGTDLGTDNWMAFDNIRVKYHPYADDAAMNTEYLEKLNAKIEEAKKLLSETSVPTGKDDLQDAINAAQKIYNDQPAWSVSQQAIFDLEDAIEAFKKIQESGNIMDVINEHKGDVSFLLPKITAWTVVANNVVRNEVTDENWDGISGSQTGLVKATKGTVSTTLSGMPAGTYRMVASVRGPKNNRILASVNNQAESAVILPGWNLGEVGTAPIINTNGVQMTAAAGDTGYNTGYNCKGWCWIAAEGTLEKAGDLTMTIASNAGEGQVSNVYLYYMDNNQVVTFKEGEKLANADKTVTADICVSNPNTIIESDKAVTTAANAAANNNLAEGKIANLVLFDGYAYKPVSATADNVTFYTNLAADSWADICLPFVPEEELTYYQPSSITGTAIIVSEAETAQNDMPYLVKPATSLSSLTAHNAELQSGAQLTNTSSLGTMTGTYETANVAEGASNYVLANNRLELVENAAKVSPFGAWLTLNEESETKTYSIIIEGTAAIITLSEACTDGKGMYYGTYSSSKPFVVSDDIVVSEISVENDKLNVREYASGAVVPANTGVMVSSKTLGDHVVVLSAQTGASVLGDANMLRPSGDDGITADDMSANNADCVFYRLTMHDGTTIGYFWGAAEGAAFDVAANKAYLAVPAAQAAKLSGFALDGVTGIGLITDNGNAAGSHTVYNLQGQRVSGNVAKGLYIVDGKKVVISK